jgi:hypothetical protein
MALVGAALAVVAVVILVAGMPEFVLLPGVPAMRPLQEGAPAEPGAPAGADTLLTVLWKALSVLIVVLFPFALIRFIISPQMRKRVMRDMLYLVALLAFNFLLARALGEAGLVSVAQEPARTSADAALQAAPPDIEADPPEWLSIIVSVGIILLLAVLAGTLQRRRRTGPGHLDRLAQPAHEAVAHLRAGADLKDVIVRCYAEMCQVVSDRRGVRREKAMTPREFEDRLTSLGLPADQVLRLTRLFESVRYGARTPGLREEQEAVACLTAIAEACGRAA